jgi:hypothetical protein
MGWGGFNSEAQHQLGGESVAQGSQTGDKPERLSIERWTRSSDRYSQFIFSPLRRYPEP